MMIDILTGALKFGFGLFLFFCLIAVAGFLRDLIRGRFQEWLRREAVIGVRDDIRRTRQREDRNQAIRERRNG